MQIQSNVLYFEYQETNLCYIEIGILSILE